MEEENYSKRIQRLKREYDDFEVLSEENPRANYDHWEVGESTVKPTAKRSSNSSPFSLANIVEDAKKLGKKSKE